MKIAVYSRKSVETGKGESIGNQIELCKQYIYSKIPEAEKSEIILYEDEGFSAKNTDRPQFQKLLSDIAQQKYAYIVCYRLDRISRSVSDFAALIEHLNNLGVSFICIKEEFDTSKPMGKAMMFIASVFAQLERETLAERVRDNMFLLARSGRWLGGTPPTGFLSEKEEWTSPDGKIKTACRLKINPDEIGAVKTIYDRYLARQTITGVSKYLISRQIKSRNGAFFSLPGIKEILSNPVYCVADAAARAYFLENGSDVAFQAEDCSEKFGLIAYNKREYQKKRAPRHEKSAWIISIGRHEGVISGIDWVKVQKILSDNKPQSGAAKAHNDYSVLSGMITCTRCGGKLFAKIRHNNPTLFDYICGNKMRGGRQLCDCPNLNGRQSDDVVCTCVLNDTDNSPKMIQQLEKLKADLKQTEKKNPINEIDAKINKIQNELDNLAQSLAQSAPVKSFLAHINKKAAALSDELEQLYIEKNKIQLELSSSRKSNPETLAKELFSLKACFPQMTVYEKRQLVKLFVPKIEFSGGRALRVFINRE